MKTLILLLSLFAAAGLARAGDLVFLTSSSSSVPMTEYRDDVLVGGILKDLGDALARELGRRAVYINMPRKRLEEVMMTGQADAMCDLRPEWVPAAKLQWTDAVLSNQSIIVSRSDTAPAASLAALADKPIGTQVGYVYSDLEAALGAHFIRDGATSDEANLAKLLAGRFDYMLTNALFFEYHRKHHARRGELNATYLDLGKFETQCGIGANAHVTLAEMNRALGTLKRRGAINAILAKYRPAR